MTPPLRLYDSLSRAVAPVPTDGPVGMYVCGITPYDTTHLGHAFTYAVFDVILRYLRFQGHEVTYVQNVTDVDDDILLRAASRGVDWRELGDRETRRFVRDLQDLNIALPEVMPRATEHIPDMVGIIEGLLAKGLAYTADGSVYFEVAKAPGFGRMCRAPYEAQLELANERGNFPDDPLKRDPLDFVLWQRSREGEPHWPSPWGEGRPGWHIECSAMSMRYLGETFAIHGGGEDLMFPHHECEIAQSEGYTGKTFARLWVHTGMVYCGGKKMSKSLGNMVFVRDLLKAHSPDAVRLAMLSHHYRHSWNIEPAEPLDTDDLAEELRRAAGGGEADAGDLQRWGGPFLEALSDDLDTPRAIGELRTLARREDAAAARCLRTLGGRVLGLTLPPGA